MNQYRNDRSIIVNGARFVQLQKTAKWELYYIPEKRLKFCIKRGFIAALSMRKNETTSYSFPWDEWQSQFLKIIDGNFCFSHHNICKLDVLINAGGAIKIKEYDRLLDPELDPIYPAQKIKTKEREEGNFASIIQF